MERIDWTGKLLSDGRYQVAKLLGDGGMAVVSLAWDRNLKTNVVIKVPRIGQIGGEDFSRRFDDEIRSLVALTHPHICRVLDVGQESGVPFAVLQYLQGGTLEQQTWLDESGIPQPVPLHDLHRWLRPVAEALDFMHTRDYVHRDIKPSNIMFDEHGYAYLSDFGVAKVIADHDSAAGRRGLTRAGTTIGTPEYMAPELILGKPIDGKCDQYALAVTVYQMVSGDLPYKGSNPTVIYQQQITGSSPRLTDRGVEVPPSLADAVNRGFALEPAARFPTCSEFAAAVVQAVPAPPVRSNRQPVLQPSGTTHASGSGSAPASLVTESTIYSCPHCEAKFRLRPNSRGRKVRCPACREAVNIAEVSPSGSGQFPMQGTVSGIQIAADSTASMALADTAANRALPARSAASNVGLRSLLRAQLWQRLRQHKLSPQQSKRLALGGGVLLLVVAAFIFGRLRQSGGSSEGKTSAVAKNEKSTPPSGTTDKGNANDDSAREVSEYQAYSNGNGTWEINGDEIRQTDESETHCVLIFGDFNWKDYDFTVLAKGEKALGIVFRATKEKCSLFVVGGENNTTDNLQHSSIFVNHQADHETVDRVPGTVDSDTWYKVRVRVRGRQCKCYRDGDLKLNVDTELQSQGAVGLRTTGSSVSYKDITVTAPDGSVLFKGLPKLPPENLLDRSE
jgi:serine/threonine protein kinase